MVQSTVGGPTAAAQLAKPLVRTLLLQCPLAHLLVPSIDSAIVTLVAHSASQHRFGRQPATI